MGSVDLVVVWRVVVLLCREGWGIVRGSGEPSSSLASYG